MLERKNYIIMTLALSFLFCSYQAAWALGNIHVGSLEINPTVSVEQKYDDNIFLEPKNQEDDDWITTTAAGFLLKMPIVPGREEDFTINGKYEGKFIKFWDHTNQDRVDHNASVSADLKFSNDVALKIEDNFQKTADPPNSELTVLEKRFRNTARTVLGYMREKVGFDLGYANIRDNYRNLNSLDKYEHVGTVTAYYQLFPKTSIFGEYNFGQILYDTNTTNSDSKYHQYRLGAKGQIAPKLTGTVKAGYKQTDYEDAGKKNFKGFAAFFNVKYDLKERTAVNFFGERSSEESTYSTNSHFEYSKIGLRIDHELLDNLFLIGSAYYQLDQYPDETTESSVTAKRKDDISDGSIGMRYEMQDWVSLEASYEYKQRDSKFATFDYKDNKVVTKVNFQF